MIDEAQLVDQLKSETHKEQAFRTLITLYKERLYWHIRNIVKSHDDSDDVLQNTFIKIYKNIHNFKGDSKLFSWMYRIATNESITFINQNAKKLQITSEEAQSSAINKLTSDVYFEGDAIQLQLQKAIATLPRKQQLVFNMKYFQDLKYSEISDILETSEGALKTSYHIAVKKIETYLAQN
ncbi:ECF RNA polymerase sigma factor SigW [Mariniflexile rhizosphaerae]|uniref:RNA polymerase sigma factor n=1 Tax=unclassified Mariniflexile TaxID=2643887 RepID=UPI000CBFB5E4|nr:RNA polymerase sigma factor [Mariniflexile sp. TRM1-10]AXP79491.1 ECF RNA polymerase sigma factor SigW [Mariniflexile sp. TRM1-10]PLB19445.1 MAG: RNA polymerase ECF-type sigma factor [Flavobacteriaceae bacterium FS1-H7996/R]